MIDLSLDKPYKSLSPFNISLPPFTIITGFNGAGKTHILQGIAGRDIGVGLESGLEVTFTYANTHTLIPKLKKNLDSYHLQTIIGELFESFVNFRGDSKHNENARLEHYYGAQSEAKLVKRLVDLSGKSIDEVALEDFYQHYPINVENSEDHFYTLFTELSHQYAHRFLDNKLNKMLQSEGHPYVRFIEDADFESNYGPAPWQMLNEIADVAQFNFEFSPPDASLKNQQYSITAYRKDTQEKLDFTELSSGEKSIMSLGLALYNATISERFPNLILLDEPDASLHPLMSKQLLSVLLDLFVNEKGINVIMTSHSPSTVAFAPEGSIYVVDRSGVVISRQPKDAALKVLCAGVPSFSVNYENRRQVFVESPFDVANFEAILTLLVPNLLPEVSLTFISSGSSRTDKNGMPVANCDQVKEICTIFHNSGNRFVFGIIDWDGKNATENNVFVLGEGTHYSIENLLLDPLLIGLLLFREKLLDANTLGIDGTRSYPDFRDFTGDERQRIVNAVVGAVLVQIGEPHGETEIIKYIDGTEVDIDKSYLRSRGHDLEDKLLKAFPKLAQIKRDQENALKQAVISKVLDDHRGLVPLKIFDVFKKIQEK